MIRIVAALTIAMTACSPRNEVTPGREHPLPRHEDTVLEGAPHESRRLVPPEAYLRSYLMWFGGLGPRGVFLRARGNDLFDGWPGYLAALGLPDYHFDVPRSGQTSTIMLAALARLGEALCVRSVEHDLHDRPPLAQRVIFAFEPIPAPTEKQFAEGLDVLHRTFLGYPLELAPSQRTARFFALYRDIAAHHARGKLTPDELGWSAVCSGLIQHPEAQLY